MSFCGKPTDPTDPTEPTDPTDPTDPTEPTDPTRPVRMVGVQYKFNEIGCCGHSSNASKNPAARCTINTN